MSFPAERTAVALRVMTAIHERTDPVKSDIERLRRWVDPEHCAAAPMDLVYQIILAELRKYSSGCEEN